MYRNGGCFHAGVKDSQQIRFRRSLLEKAVALGKQPVVSLGRRQVFPVHLGKDRIGETPPFLPGFAHERDIPGRNHDHRKDADMFRHAPIRLVIPDQFLFPFGHFDRKAGFQAVFHDIGPADGEPGGTVPPVETVRGRESAFGHGKVVDRVHEIGLPFAVVTADAVDIRREGQFLECDIPEILYDYFLQGRHGIVILDCKYMQKYNFFY